MQRITVRVPATTSNLGPGFDCLGAALALHNRVRVTRGDKGRMPPIAAAAARKFFARTGAKPFSFRCEIDGDVPMGRGLGSSATVRAGVVVALNELARTDLSRLDLFSLTAVLEGHPDNAAPAIFGGFTVARGESVQRFQIDRALHFVLLVPAFAVETARARRLLPKKISRLEAVRSAGNAAAITAAFATREYEKLRGSFRDGLHQPFRKKLVPFLDDAITAAENAGALGAFLSGSGSTICAIALAEAGKIGRAMRRACPTEADIRIVHADNRGARIAR
ncbi:MAG: homoserine kinase [Verrucomicrobiota bacterium]|nr:homoserine kinase [Verrucomicrobiota bacterium]